MTESWNDIRLSERWIRQISRWAPSQIISSRGVLHRGERKIDYYTSQPSSCQWIALGIVRLSAPVNEDDTTHQILVGTGESEQAAVASLKARFVELMQLPAAAPPLIYPTGADSQPSDWFG